MKVCIVTIIDYQNYGNRLQNYAMYKLLELEKWDALSGLQVFSKEEWENSSSNELIRVFKHLIPLWLFVIREKYRYYLYYTRSIKSERIKGFKAFTQKYIPTLPAFVVKNNEQLKRILKEYSFDYYIAGSDQVWNPYFAGRDINFLTFAPIHKRLSFAASLGVNSIPESQKKRYGSMLKQMKYISVREIEGVRIVKDLTGRNNIEFTLDPTLLLGRAHWEELIVGCTIDKPSHYIASYFLGKTPEAVYTFAHKEGLSLLEMNSINMPNLYNVDPISFLSIIHDADYVLTDSFHGMAFSIIFNKEFYIYRRISDKHADMFSRLESLLSLFEINDRLQDYNEVKIVPAIGKEKWDRIDKILEEQHRLSINSLKIAMGIKDSYED